MNATVIIIEILVFTAIFTAACFATTGGKNNLQVDNYPPEIQKEYFKTHDKPAPAEFTKTAVIRKVIAILIFAAVLVLMARLAGAESFLQGFVLSFGMMVWIGAYDTFFMDWVLFANMKRFRLEGTEHMDKEYHQKWFHLKGMLFPGTVFALIPAALVGLVVMLIG
ncbi:MAG: hypothetical protein IJ740_15575 [Ruminococcus sp.]|nr:hypothetical protein [Ruminococcus sp.]